ncbi:LPXTG cell wall anchor domain-containing protein [Clostridium tarantellae]|uniref:LPXTG cell wall anchor domain-containing protein n=2 Tax=Clostridium tarantellae TaxID=39493 RepID=A0A6I1MMU5_9CLOT|nr:LPXTG cell wall anchor domain-containing protein [Clostridium tarantellae]
MEEGTFDNLTCLKSISLNYNYLNKLPDNIFNNLDLLESLYLDNNNLRKLPNSMENLNNITYLCLGKNNLEFIPEYIGKLEKLKNLELQHNNINKIPSSFYNLKNLTKFNIEDNEILDIPKNIDEIFEKANIDISLNKVNTDGMINLERLTIKPQKIETKTLFKAENGLITIESELSPLDILCWDKFWDRSLPNNKFANIENYKKYLNNKNVVDLLNSKNYDWTIKTDIQKKDNNGQYKTLKNILEEDKAYKPINYTDKNMKNGDEYRVITTVLASQTAIKELEFRDFIYATAIVNEYEKSKLEKNEKKNEVSIYEIKNNIEDTSDIGKSMVRKVLKDTTKVEVNNEKKYLTFDMDTQGYLKDIDTFIDGKEVPHEKIKGEGNNLKIKVQTPENNFKVGMKMFVIPMNRSVDFSIVHDKNTLKPIKKDLNESNAKLPSEKKLQKDTIKEKVKNEEIKNSNSFLNNKNEDEKISKSEKDKYINENNKILPNTGQPIGASILSIVGSSIMALGVFLKKKGRK